MCFLVQRSFSMPWKAVNGQSLRLPLYIEQVLVGLFLGNYHLLPVTAIRHFSLFRIIQHFRYRTRKLSFEFLRIIIIFSQLCLGIIKKTLGNSQLMAKKRFFNLENSLITDSSFSKEYHMSNHM